MQTKDTPGFNNPVWQLIWDASKTRFSQSLAVPITFAILQITTGFTFEDVPIFRISQHYIDLAAGLTAIAIFRFASVGKLEKRTPLILTGFWLWLISAIGSVLVPQFILTLIGNGFYEDQLILVMNGLISYPMAMFAIGVTTSIGLSSKARLAELAKQRKKLLALRDSIDDEIVTYQTEMTSEVQRRLGQALEAIDISSANNRDKIRQVSTQLRSLIDLVIRPLSFDLSGNQEVLGNRSFAQPSPEQSSSWFSQVQAVKFKVQIKQLVSPALFAISALPTLVPAFLYVAGGKAATLTFISVLIISGSLWALRRIAGSWKVSALLAIAVIATVATLVGYVTSLIGNSIFITGLNPAEAAIGFLTSAFINLIFLFFTARLEHAISDAERVNTSIEDLLTRLRQEFWVTRKQLARLVHGKVQAKLLAAALRMNGKPNLDSQDIVRAKSEIREAIDSLEIGPEHDSETFTEQFQRLIDVWDGVCDLHLQISEQTLETINNDRVARSCFFEVIGEAVANAAKYSTSSTVALSVTLITPQLLDVRIQTTGISDQNEKFERGYGSTILDEVTTGWSLDVSNEVVTLKALIPVLPSFQSRAKVTRRTLK